MRHNIERQIPFTPEEMKIIKAIGEDEGRAFKYQAAQLIKEALLTRKILKSEAL